MKLLSWLQWTIHIRFQKLNIRGCHWTMVLRKELVLNSSYFGTVAKSNCSNIIMAALYKFRIIIIIIIIIHCEYGINFVVFLNCFLSVSLTHSGLQNALRTSRNIENWGHTQWKSTLTFWKSFFTQSPSYNRLIIFVYQYYATNPASKWKINFT